MKKLMAMVLAGVMCFSMLTGCGGSDTANGGGNGENTSGAESTGDKIKLGVSMASLNSTFFEAELQAIETACEEQGIDLVSVVADGDAAKQQSQIEDLISQKVDAAIVLLQDRDTIGSSLEALKEAGIYTVLMGRRPADESNVDVGVYCDNAECARVDVEAMKQAQEEMGYETLKVIELVGKLTDQNAVERSEAFKKYAEEAGFEIVAEVATEWNVDTTFSRLTDTLNNIDDYNAMYIPADTYITPAMSVLQAQGRWVPFGEEGHVIISSIDGSSSGIDFVNDGFVYCTANTDAFDFGDLSVQAAVDLVKGNPVESEIPVEATALTKDVIAEAGDTIWGNVFK